MSSRVANAPFGVLAEFNTTAEVYHACEKVRDAGFKKWDAHTPFPVHGLDKAMGLKASKLPWISLIMALIGGSGGMTLQWWISAVDYPLVISGKPLFSWQAFIPVTFELTILLGTFGTILGMLALNRLPRFHHPLFSSKRFERVTDDKFFISIEATDPKFDPVGTSQFLQKLGASHIEIVEH